MTSTSVPTVALNRLVALANLGVEVDPCIEWVDNANGIGKHPASRAGTVAAVWMPYSDTDWQDMTVRFRPFYIGGSGRLTWVQDMMCAINRDEGKITSAQLLVIGAILLEDYVGFEVDEVDDVDDEDDEEDELLQFKAKPLSDPEFAEGIKRWRNGGFDPWEKLAFVYRVLEPGLSPEIIDVPHTPRDEAMNLAHDLQTVLGSMAWHDLFQSNPGDEARRSSQRLVIWARALPLVRKLLDLLVANDFVFHGFALVGPENELLRDNIYGLCLYPSEAEAERIVELWRRAAALDDTPRTIDVRIIPATVSVAEGIKLQTS